ncbi:hypothetical protein Tco_1162319, partial [Tanacetum coccineum]
CTRDVHFYASFALRKLFQEDQTQHSTGLGESHVLFKDERKVKLSLTSWIMELQKSKHDKTAANCMSEHPLQDTNHTTKHSAQSVGSRISNTSHKMNILMNKSET